MVTWFHFLRQLSREHSLLFLFLASRRSRHRCRMQAHVTQQVLCAHLPLPSQLRCPLQAPTCIGRQWTICGTLCLEPMTPSSACSAQQSELHTTGWEIAHTQASVSESAQVLTTSLAMSPFGCGKTESISTLLEKLSTNSSAKMSEAPLLQVLTKCLLASPQSLVRPIQCLHLHLCHIRGTSMTMESLRQARAQRRRSAHRLAKLVITSCA